MKAYDMLTYSEYLRSSWWTELRSHALWMADYRCQTCGVLASDSELHVHHIRRDHLGCEKPWEIAVLCDRCHQAIEESLLVGAK